MVLFLKKENHLLFARSISSRYTLERLNCSFFLKMLAIPVERHAYSIGCAKDLRRFQQEFQFEGEIRELLRTERVFSRMVPTNDSLRKRSSSFMEVPILDRRRRSDDDIIDKRPRPGVEMVVPLPQIEEQPRKHRMCLAEY